MSPARRSGQALVEFNVGALLFFTVFFAMIEVSRALNLQLVLQTLAREAAVRSARADVLERLLEPDVEAYVRSRMARYGYLDDARLVVQANVNDQSSTGRLRTRVRLEYSFGPLLLPRLSEDMTLQAVAIRLNQLQVIR